MSRAPSRRSSAGARQNGLSRCSRCCPTKSRSTTPISNRSGVPPRITIWRSSITASPGRHLISPATPRCGTTCNLARLCSHPWGAMRFMAGFLAGGILDRYPGLRLCVLECGFGWLPFWVRRMDEQVSYVGRTAKLKMLPSEHFQAGRVFCNVEAHEHEPMFKMVTEAIGEDCLMFGSDYPHFESWFPNSIDKILEWESVKGERARKLFWGNAQRCFKQT